MISAGDQRFTWEGRRQDNRERVSLETVSLLPPPSFLKQTAKDRILLNT